jgi:hypothetical protein
MMMNIFDLRQQLISNYSSYVKSFIEVGNTRIQRYVEQELFEHGMLWPEPLIQLNPLFQPGTSLDALVADDILHPACARIFRRNKEPLKPQGNPRNCTDIRKKRFGWRVAAIAIS